MRRLATLFVLVAVGACYYHHVRANIGMPAQRDVEFVGATYDIHSSWEAACSDNDNILTGAHHPTYYGCKEKPYTMTVECSGPCQKEVLQDSLKNWTARITFTQPGRIRVHAVLTRTDNGDTFDQEGEFDVVWPDRVELYCSKGYVSETCEKGVDAADPLIFPELAGKGATPTPLLTINGKPHPVYDHGVSLAEVFPEAKTERGGVQPGVYDVEVAVGPVHGRWHVVAR